MNSTKQLIIGALLASALCLTGSATALAGLGEPPPAGFKVLYMFTGVRSEMGAAGTAATSIHCTSFGAEPTQVRIHWFNTNGALQTDNILVLGEGNTGTFSSRATEFYADNATASLTVHNGSARIMTNGSTNVVCTGQVLDPINDPPSYITSLPSFGKNGKVR